MEKEEKPEDCEACNYETQELMSSRCFDREGKEYFLWFCDLCIHTHAATSKIYPTNHRDVTDALYAISFIGNKIIEEIKKINPHPLL